MDIIISCTNLIEGAAPNDYVSAIFQDIPAYPAKAPLSFFHDLCRISVFYESSKQSCCHATFVRCVGLRGGFVRGFLLLFYVADVLCFTGFGGRGKMCFFYVAEDLWEDLVFFMLGPGALCAPAQQPTT